MSTEYYNESTYKEWFDRNYPELTIEKASWIYREFNIGSESFKHENSRATFRNP